MTEKMLNQSVTYVLAAEDDNDDQLLLQSAFEELKAPFSLAFVDNGIDLIDFLDQAKELPKLLILDLNMPKMSGLEALDVLQSKPYFKTFKTVVFSTTYSEGEQKRLQQQGIFSCFTKPSKFDELLAITSEFVQLVENKVN